MRNTPNKGRKEAGKKQDITISQRPTEKTFPAQLKSPGRWCRLLVALILSLLINMASPRRVSAHLLT
jgi:hypothetical protein